MAVDQQEIGCRIKRHYRAYHRKMAGAQDVQFIDFGDAGMGDGDLGLRMDEVGQPVARPGAQFLGVVQPLGDRVEVQHDGGGRHRPGQRTAPDLVHPRDAQEAPRTGGALKTVIGSGHAPCWPKAGRHARGKTMQQNGEGRIRPSPLLGFCLVILRYDNRVRAGRPVRIRYGCRADR